jgi:hypothetical protein
VTREQKDSSFGDFVKPITPSKASDVFDQASHDYEALKDYRYYSGLMSPEEEQRETWHREAHEAARARDARASCTTSGRTHPAWRRKEKAPMSSEAMVLPWCCSVPFRTVRRVCNPNRIRIFAALPVLRLSCAMWTSTIPRNVRRKREMSEPN